MSLELRLPPTRQAPSEARALLDRLQGRIDEGLIGDAQLLVSELVTNSVRHAGLGSRDEIQISVDARGDAIRVAVSDPGIGFRPGARTSGPADESGWGLFLVERLADRWGVEGRGHTRVWFELQA